MTNNINTAAESFGKLLMPDGSEYTKDSRKTGLNNNVAVIGPSGCGKSSVMGVLNSLSSGGSLIISDPKGGLYRTLNGVLRQMGYRVLKLDFTHPENSMHYEPLSYIRSTQDIRKIAHSLVFGVNARQKSLSRDPYWENSAESLLCAFIGLFYERRDPDISLIKIMDLLSRFTPYEDLDEERLDGKPVYIDFHFHERAMKERNGEESWACKMFRPFKSLSERTLSCVISTLTSLLTSFEGNELAEMFINGKFDFTSLSREKTVIFVIVSDTDRSNDTLANLFYSQAMNELCDHADNRCENGRLPMSVTFILDDFATNCRIANFENIISNIRARNISTIIMLQSIGQLDEGYGASAQTILNNCDTLIFMGANSSADASYFAEKANKPLHAMLEMKLFTSWIFRRTEKPRMVQNIIPDEYLSEVVRSLHKQSIASYEQE